MLLNKEIEVLSPFPHARSRPFSEAGVRWELLGVGDVSHGPSSPLWGRCSPCRGWQAVCDKYPQPLRFAACSVRGNTEIGVDLLC